MTVVQLKLDHILAVLPELTEHVAKRRALVAAKIEAMGNHTKEECFALSLPFVGHPLDEQVMLDMGILQIGSDKMEVAPKWKIIVQIALELHYAPRPRRREIKSKLEKIRRKNGAFDFPSPPSTDEADSTGHGNDGTGAAPHN